MRITLDDLARTFPTLGALARNTTPQVFKTLLVSELGAYSDNLAYCEDIAAVLINHIHDGLYTDLTYRLQSYRATVDLFVSVAPPDRISVYIRSIARALAMPRSPRMFRRHLQSCARQFQLVIPESFLTGREEAFTRPVQIRLPITMYQDLKARAKAQKTSVSDLIREALYAQEAERNKGL